MLYAFEVNRAFGRRLREVRERKGISQQDLAVRSEIGRTTIANIEMGGQSTSLFQMLALARALGIAPQELLPDASQEPASDLVKRLERQRELLLG